MKYPIFYTICIILTLFVGAFGAQKWAKIGRYNHQNVYVRDFKQYRNVARVWVLKGRVQAQIEFDCANNTIKQLKVFGRSNTAWRKVYKVAPNTFGEWIYNKVCF